MSEKSTIHHCSSSPLKLFTISIATILLFFSLDLSLLSSPPPPLNLANYLGNHSVLHLPSISPPTTTSSSSSFSWLRAHFPANFTEITVSRWLRAGRNGSRTANISIPAFDSFNATVIRLSASLIHELVFTAIDERGQPRLNGGDYFETDLSGSSWKSRPPVEDFGNGTYSVKLQLHPDFAAVGGDYVFTIVLLFRSFEGLKLSPERFKYRKELRRIPIMFYNTVNYSLPELAVCSSGDFSREMAWSGRWTKLEGKEECPIDDEGRYRCLGPEVLCKRPWCEGKLGALESNGWVYSAHCSFRIFTSDSAWKCLNNKWLFLWGDSNHVDTIRNLLNFVLGLSDISSVPRRFDSRFVNPVNRTESVRITSIFNGHWNDSMNYLGLHSLRFNEFRELLWQYFREKTAPDVLILNSGLHDGVYWKSIRAYVEGAEFAAKFWEDVMRHLNSKSDNTTVLKNPKLFYRTTIATGGYARDLAFNPSKMETFNGILIEKLKQKGLLTGGVIDQFDMTFPWHYDNRCNDGVHYGRAPAKKRWRDGEIGHQYFVDLMLGHVLLNAICNP